MDFAVSQNPLNWGKKGILFDAATNQASLILLKSVSRPVFQRGDGNR